MRRIIKINNLNDVKEILDSLKPMENYISTLDENSFEYEDLCERVEDVLIEIEKALIGKQEYNMSNLAKCDIRIFSYWQYLGNKMTFKKLMKELKENSNGLLLN